VRVRGRGLTMSIDGRPGQRVLWAAIFALTCGSALWGTTACLGGGWQGGATVHNDGRVVVQLESRKPTGAGPRAVFSHPARIDPVALEALLRNLGHTRAGLGRKNPQRSISERHVSTLARALTRGIGDAGPAQRVRFSVTHRSQKTGPWFVPNDLQTRGAVFVEPEGVLNIAFERLADPVDTSGSGGQDPTAGVGRRVYLDVPLGTELHRSPAGKVDSLWLTWHFADSSEPPLAAKNDPATMIRLQFLKELHDDGSIRDIEYERQKQELLFGVPSPEPSLELRGDHVRNIEHPAGEGPLVVVPGEDLGMPRAEDPGLGGIED